MRPPSERERLRELSRSRRRRVARRLLFLGAVVVAGGGVTLFPTQRERRGRPHAVPAPPPTPTAVRHPPYPVGLYVTRYTEPGRTVTYANGSAGPRTLLTYIRYPAVRPGLAAPPAQGPFPLLLFGHGFDEVPSFYAKLLNGVAAAGFVVAAPVFPLENSEAPGGPLRSDLPNEPRDMRFVLERLFEENRKGGSPLSGLINASAVAVSGQSDGGDVALALGYDATERDPAVKAVVVYSGAELPGLDSWDFGRGEPPLLATQGTADPINLPAETEAFFADAFAPKYLLWLEGASHLEPYSTEEPQLRVVVGATVAFLRGYLEREKGALRRLEERANVPGVSRLVADR